MNAHQQGVTLFRESHYSRCFLRSKNATRGTDSEREGGETASIQLTKGIFMKATTISANLPLPNEALLFDLEGVYLTAYILTCCVAERYFPIFRARSPFHQAYAPASRPADHLYRDSGLPVPRSGRYPGRAVHWGRDSHCAPVGNRERRRKLPR
jgi:hypothetical protein